MSPTKPLVKPAWQQALVTLSFVVTATVVFAALYWMRSVCIPIALAVFFTYVLAPLVVFLQRRGLGRVPSVVVVVAAAVAAFLGTSYMVTRQVADLSDTLAENKDRIVAKVAQARATLVGDGQSRWAQMLDELERTVTPPPPAVGAPQPVTVEPAKASWLSHLNVLVGPTTEAFGLAAFAFVLVVFMLLAKEDMHDRLLRLLGDGGVTSATRVTGEATRRVSRYLLTQMLLNTAFGLVIAAGLFALGVKYALLWGFIAGLMRYVPYLGVWVAVLPPTLFTFAVTDGWGPVVGVVVLFVTLEVACGQAVEPRLFGASLGVSEVALLVSAAFWSFLWGPIGLILSGPITTCLVAVGKHLPRFRFLAVLLGTEPPLTPPVALFQRLMARNQDEAMRVVEAATPADNPAAVFDTTVIPALALVKQAKFDGEYDDAGDQTVLDIAREVIDELAGGVQTAADEPGPQEPGERVRLLACPAADEADRLSLEALAGMLPKRRWEVTVVGVATLVSELVERAEQLRPHVICIGALPPSGLAHVRYLCKRLRARFPDVHILVGRWGDPEVESLSATLTDAGATAVEGTLTEVKNLLTGWLPVFHSGPAATAGSRPGSETAFGLAGTPSA